MHFSKITAVVVLAKLFSPTSAAAVAGKIGVDRNIIFKRTPTTNTSTPDLTLDLSAVATGSEFSGNDPPVVGQATSATSNNNFINFCAGLTLTNGLQNPNGSCNGIPMGKIPAEEKTISTIILSPQPGATIPANQAFNVSLQTIHLTAGSFTNATSTYYTVPQDLDSAGQIIGHVHVTIQSLGSSLTPTTPPDPTTFAFFLGINDAGNGQGLLRAPVTTGLAAGFYRVCTMASSSNHQPVLSAIAKRGAQDDCTKFIVGDSASSSSTSTASSSASGTDTSSTVVATSATSSSASSTSSTSIGGISAPPVTDSDDSSRPFLVNGNTFVNKSAAVQRACAIQNNACSNAVNGGTVTGFSVGDCNAQETSCNAATS